MMKPSRRTILKGLFGATLGLPLLEGLRPHEADAQSNTTEPFAIFFRQANGVQSSRYIDEPERFFPRTDNGTQLTPESMQDRAVGELVDYRDRLLVLDNVNLEGYGEYADGHANGAIQALTARGPAPGTSSGDSMADGESLDWRIGSELNPNGNEPLYMYVGKNSGWLGGACISWRGSGASNKRSPIHNPWQSYLTLVGGMAGGGANEALLQALAERRESINDILRSQTQTLMSSPGLSGADKTRLEQHFASIRDLEVALTCALDEQAEAELEGLAVGYDSTDGNETLDAARLHMRVAALAVACGHTRAATLQVGSGNDGSTRYWDGGTQMENYHFISHRILSHGGDGTPIPNADLLHHQVDIQFAQTFKYLLDALDAYQTIDGGSLLDAGMAIWYNDSANGPPHAHRSVPYIIAGSAGGQLKQGEIIALAGSGSERNHDKLLNTIGAAVGVTNGNGAPLDNFGDLGTRGRCTEILTG
ncbi:MAG: DUF1552 domain-containing protein [Polyangiaceae bacterium]